MKMLMTALLASLSVSACAATTPPTPTQLTLNDSQQAQLRTLLNLTPGSPFTVTVNDQDSNGKLNAGDIAVVSGGIANAEVSRRVLSASDVATINGKPAGGTSDGLSRLRAAEAQWHKTRPQHYAYTLQHSCFCAPDALKPIEIRVYQDTIQEARILLERKPLPADRKDSAMTIDALFQLIHEAIAQKAATIDVKYDPQYGFPSHVFIDRSKMMADEELSLTASNFKVASGLKPAQIH